MNKKFFGIALLAASLYGCAPNPADNVPKAGVNTPAPQSSPVAQATATTPATPVASPTAAVEATGTPAAVAGTVLPFQEGTEVKFVGSKVTGSHNGGFRTVTGSVTLPGEDLTQATIDVTIDMTSTYSDDEKLTGHLMSPDFFDVAQFPQSSFKSTKIEATDNGFLVTGDLTLHGVTKSISFPAEMARQAEELTAKAEFAINRKDFNIVYPGKPDDLIRDEVVISLNVKAAAAKV